MVRVRNTVPWTFPKLNIVNDEQGVAPEWLPVGFLFLNLPPESSTGRHPVNAVAEENMTVIRGFMTTIASGLAFACFGAIAGYLLGSIAPDYYRTVFRIPPQALIDPAQAGLGLGVTQGLGAGLIVGLVIVVSVGWHNSRMCTLQPPSTSARDE